MRASLGATRLGVLGRVGRDPHPFRPSSCSLESVLPPLPRPFGQF